jgi:XTP/dITP diphosphohydrolase
MGNSIVLASNNAGKAREIAELLGTEIAQLRAQSAYGVPEAEETGTTFVENAIIKARNACHHTGLPAIADDSGIEVDALGGAPGVRSARFAGEQGDDAANNRLLVERLSGVPAGERSARYYCVMVYMAHAADPTPVIAEGSWEGWIQDEPRGDNGFGYDPHFLVDGQQLTAAELDPATKNRISHRGQAMRRLAAAFTIDPEGR